MTNIEKVAGIVIVGLGVIGTCVAVKAITQVVKTKRALKGIKEQLDIVDDLIEKAEEIKIQGEEIH